MCGIVGISAETNVAAEIYDSLLMLSNEIPNSLTYVIVTEITSLLRLTYNR